MESRSVSYVANEEKMLMFVLVCWQLSSVEEESLTREIREENSKRLAAEESFGDLGHDEEMCVCVRWIVVR